MFVIELGRIIFTAAISTLTAELIRQKERRSEKPPATIGEDNMSYDLVGDDSFGGIGADVLFGADDDALLRALSISGGGVEDLIAGLGNTEIVGAAQHRVPPTQGKLSPRAALQRIAMRNAGAVVKTALDRRRRYPLGFVPTTVPALTSALIPSAPQNLFRPERLVIPSDIAFDIGVVDIKVGNQSQLVQSVEVPGALFSEVAIDTNVTFDTAEVGNQVSVQARNKTAADIEFTAGLIGTIAK
jgi:hypothetical protein